MTDLLKNEQDLKAFFDKLVTQMNVLQTFFLQNQQRLISLENIVRLINEKIKEINKN
jgi:hypothetical protein